MADKVYSNCESVADRVDWLENYVRNLEKDEGKLSPKGVVSDPYWLALDGPDGKAVPHVRLPEGWEEAGIKDLDALQDQLTELRKVVTARFQEKLEATWAQAGNDIKIIDGVFGGDKSKRASYRFGRTH